MSEASVAPVESPVAAPEPLAPAAAESIAEHAATFTPGAVQAGPDDDDGPLDDVADENPNQPRLRGSRAKSKQAAARINKLKGEAFELRQRLEALEAKQQTPKVEAPVVRQVPPVPRVEFTEPVPKIEDFGHEEDPYGAWLEAKIEHKQRKAQAERDGQQAQGQHQRQFEDTQRYYQQVESTHKQRLVEVASKNPAALKALQSVTVAPPPLLDWAIMLDNQSADVAVFLATHPDVLDEFVLYTEAKPVNEQTVAITRRLLRQRMTAGMTGSVAPSQPHTAPRPPNPVRTAAMRPTNDSPGVASSIAEHAKLFGPKAR